MIIKNEWTQFSTVDFTLMNVLDVPWIGANMKLWYNDNMRINKQKTVKIQWLKAIERIKRINFVRFIRLIEHINAQIKYNFMLLSLLYNFTKKVVIYYKPVALVVFKSLQRFIYDKNWQLLFFIYKKWRNIKAED